MIKICIVFASRLATNQPVEIGIRPEHLTLTAADAPSANAGARFAGEVSLVEQLGESHLVYVQTASGAEPVVRGSAHTRVRPGDKVHLQAPVETIYVFDADGSSHDRLFPEGPAHG